MCHYVFLCFFFSTGNPDGVYAYSKHYGSILTIPLPEFIPKSYCLEFSYFFNKPNFGRKALDMTLRANNGAFIARAEAHNSANHWRRFRTEYSKVFPFKGTVGFVYPTKAKAS